MIRSIDRVWAIVSRELLRFRRGTAILVMSLMFPLVQMVALGYAFAGDVRHLRIGLVDQDHGPSALRLREFAQAVAAGPATFYFVDYAAESAALSDLRKGALNAVVIIPPEFSRRSLKHERAPIALVEDNSDNFIARTLIGSVGTMVDALNENRAGIDTNAQRALIEVVELYPYVPYIQYVLPGAIASSVFMMVMFGGGIIFIEDKARGLHEGYLVTPISKFELILGFTLSGAVKSTIVGTVLMVVGSLVAGLPNPYEPLRFAGVLVVIVFSACALVSMMFLLVSRVNDPLVPRAIFGALNTFLFFPSGAIYPVQGFPYWLQVISALNPFTYSVHALKSLLLRNRGGEAIAGDLLFLGVFTVVAMAGASALFKRRL